MSKDSTSSIASTLSADAPPVLVRRPFDKVTITLHWTTLLFVLVLIGSGLLHDQVEDKPWAAPLLGVHQSIGLTIWMLTVFRLLWRLTGANFPPFPASMTPLHQLGARLSEYGLYALLLIQPATGVAQTIFGGHRIQLFTWSIPSIVRKDLTVAGVFHEIHERGAWCMIVLVSLHATAALVHHFILRDDVLEAMAPVLRPGRCTSRLRHSGKDSGRHEVFTPETVQGDGHSG
jgi:superoxide oxidase